MSSGYERYINRVIIIMMMIIIIFEIPQVSWYKVSVALSPFYSTYQYHGANVLLQCT